MADHQLAEALAQDVDVVYLNPPTPITHPWRHRVRKAAPHVTVVRTLRLPFRRVRLFERISERMIAAQARRAVRLRAPDRVAVIEGTLAFRAADAFPGATVVYWAQDDWIGLAEIVGGDPVALRDREALLLRRAHAVIAANPDVAERLRTETRTPVHLVPFGADTDAFRRAIGPAADEDAPCSAVLMGTMNARIDFAILEAVADTGRALTLIGPLDAPELRQRFERLCARPNVIWLGEVSFDALPEHLRACSVGLVPYTHSRFNRGSFPLKTLEYLAAGLPVVATDLPAIRWLGCDDIVVTDDPARFAEAVCAYVDAGRPSPRDRRRRTRFTDEHRWSSRAARFLDVISTSRAGGDHDAL